MGGRKLPPDPLNEYLTVTITSNADEEIEDLIYIAKSKDKIVAIIEGSNKISLNLQANE